MNFPNLKDKYFFVAYVLTLYKHIHWEFVLASKHFLINNKYYQVLNQSTPPAHRQQWVYFRNSGNAGQQTILYTVAGQLLQGVLFAFGCFRLVHRRRKECSQFFLNINIFNYLQFQIRKGGF